MNNFGKNIGIWLIIGLVLIALFNLFQGANEQHPSSKYTYSDFMGAVKGGTMAEVKIQGNVLQGRLNDGTIVQTFAYPDSQLINTLSEKTKVNILPADDKSSGFWGIFLSWFPMLLFIGVWIFFMRQMQGGGGKAMGFGKSKAKLMNELTGRITFKDVAGVEEAKQEVEEIVEFLKDPQKFQRLGGQIPKGVLLIGSPGTGKTLLARAIAGEANVPFFSISGSDFVEMFVGVGASRVRDMFEQGKKNAPCIIFIDEIDAVGRHRGAGLGGGNDEREQTLNQLLVEMDGFESNEGVILVAATNRPDVLDPALLRPGRFDRQVVVPNPDVTGREQILRVHMNKLPSLAGDVDSKTIARSTPGFSGADLKNLVNEAALLAARRGRKNVSMSEFEEAKDKVLMGAERRSLAMTEDEKKLTAYHEGGHALVTIYSPASDPIHKATIVPRGRALGMVMRLPEGDRLSVTKEKLQADLAVAMGGRVAEELIFGAQKVTTGASSDIEMATNIARKMVTEWGMSDVLGPILYGEADREVYLGYSAGGAKKMSDTTADKIDAEVRAIVEHAYARAKEVLTKHIDELHTVALGLIEHETLSGDEIKVLLKGEKIVREAVSKPLPKTRFSVPNAAANEQPKPEKPAPKPKAKKPVKKEE